MRQTKTTGTGKRVRELPGGDAYALGIFHGGHIGEKRMSYAQAVAGSQEVFNLLEGYEKELIPRGWERFWTEHLERLTLASGLAALGAPKEDRDLLGRWNPEGADVYIRTYNSVVRRMQRKFAKVIRGERAYESLDEGSIMEEFKSWLHLHWIVPEDKAESAVEAWKKRLRIGDGRPFSVSEGSTTIYEGNNPSKPRFAIAPKTYTR